MITDGSENRNSPLMHRSQHSVGFTGEEDPGLNRGPVLSLHFSHIPWDDSRREHPPYLGTGVIGRFMNASGRRLLLPIIHGSVKGDQ